MQFYANGQMKFSHNVIDERFDRAASYDRVGRMTEAYTGSEARDFINNTNSGTATGPYRQSYQFNAFDQVIQEINRIWDDNRTTTTSYENNRRQSWAYDAAGFVIAADGRSFARDAAGRNTHTNGGGKDRWYQLDGDGRMLKQAESHNGNVTSVTYYLASTMLGGLAVADLNASGQRTKRYIYAGNRKLAEEAAGAVTWSHEEPLTGSRGDSTASGLYSPKAEFNADGVNVGFESPESNEIPDTDWPMRGFGSGSHCSAGNPTCITCYLDGFEQNCADVMHLIDVGAAQQCPNNDCGPRNVWNPVTHRHELTPLTQNRNNGQLGYWPNGSNGPGVVYDSMGNPRVTSVSSDGHSEMVWRCCDNDGNWYPVPTAYMGTDTLALEPQNPGPHGPAPGQKLSQADCDKKIAAIFGGPGAVAATVNEPSTLLHPAAGRDRYDHLAGNGVFHLYTNAQGTEATVGLYTPPGFIGRPATGTVYNGPNDPSPGEVNYNYERFNYRGGLSISFVHAGNPGVDRNDTNAAGSIRVGNIAGPGGAGTGYNHTHVNVYLNGKRVDPRSIFCK